jgi:hypothetical protein
MCAGVRVYIRYGDADRLPVDACIVEEDTACVMNATNDVSKVKPEHPVRIHTDLLEFEPRPPGSAHLRGGSPLQIAAVVFDFDAERATCAGWVGGALDEGLGLARAHERTRVAVSFLGVRNSLLSPTTFLKLLRSSLVDGHGYGIQELWLVTGEARADQFKDVDLGVLKARAEPR